MKKINGSNARMVSVFTGKTDQEEASCVCRYAYAATPCMCRYAYVAIPTAVFARLHRPQPDKMMLQQGGVGLGQVQFTVCNIILLRPPDGKSRDIRTLPRHYFIVTVETPVEQSCEALAFV